MPFGLKNAGATYQRAMSTIFRDHLRKTVECYVDDIAVKSRNKDEHLRDLRTMFDIMRAHQLKMNPTKSFLGVSSGKFLGLLSHQKEFILTPTKSKPSRACIHQGTSRSLEACKAGWPISEDSLQICQAAVNRSPDS